MSSRSSNWLRLSQTIVDNEWLVLILLLPGVLFPSPLRYLALLVIPLLWLLRKICFGQFVVSTPLNLAIVVLLLTILVSLYATFDIQLSLPRIAGIVYGVAVYYAAADAGRSWRRLAVGVGFLIACGLVVAALSLIGTRWVPKLFFLNAITDALPNVILFSSAAPEGFSPNQVAGVLLWVAPICVVVTVLVLKKPLSWQDYLGRRQALVTTAMILAASLIIGGTFLLTQSRSGYLGMVIGLLVLGVAGRGYSRHMVIGSLVLLALLAVASLWFLVVTDWRMEASPVGSELIEFSEALSLQDRLEMRTEIWSRAIYGIEDFPITGMGVGTFRRVVPVLYPLFLILPDSDIAHAHNQLLQVGLDLGIPGLVAYLAIWLASFAMLWQVWRSAPQAQARVLALGFAAALLGYFVYGLTETVALGAKPGFIYWLLLGLVAGLYQRVNMLDT